jgi:hypothetical protein
MGTTWAPKDEPTQWQKWEGDCLLDDMEGAEPNSFSVEWKQDKGYLYEFPNPNLVYEKDKTLLKTSVKMPNGREIQEKQDKPQNREKQKSDQEKTQEEVGNPLWYDVSTWGQWVEDPNANITLLVKSELRHHLGISSDIDKKARHLDMLVLWLESAREMDSWNAGFMLKLGKALMEAARDQTKPDVVADAIHQELHGTTHPKDTYGLAQRKIEGKSEYKYGGNGKKQQKCYHCQMVGHVASNCFKKHPELKSGFRKGGTGGVNTKSTSVQKA